mgnify:CR=1 FL=1
MNTSVANIPLDNCIMNASGCCCQTSLDLFLLQNSVSGAIVTKSCTLSERLGNEEPRYFQNDLLSINSMGLPNGGYDFYKNWIRQNNENKPVFFSICGQSPDEMQTLFQNIESDFSDSKNILCEVNISCPNVKGRPQLGYDFPMFEEILRKISESRETKIPFGVKLPPYFDPIFFGTAADILKKNSVSYITTINSLGNGLVIDWNKEQPVIKPKDGLGGVGGKVCKPIGLSNVYQFYQELGNKIDIIGCGGIDVGTDVFEYILAGANAVQIGSQLYRERPKSCLQRITDEFTQLLSTKKYDNVFQFRGRLYERFPNHSL